MNLLSLLAQTTQLNDQTFFLPRQASQDAPQIDFAWNMILITTTIFFFIVVGAMTFFVIKYRRRTIGAHATSTVTHNTPLEIVWTFVPLVIVICFFFVGFKGFMNYDNPPSNARIVDVQGSQWAFNFTYPNGSHSGELFVEEGVPVRLNLHSIDVLHALYVPVMRVQRNLVPFRQTVMWFVPVVLSPNEGFPIFCTQYCGEGHSEMLSHCHVLKTAQYNEKMLELANPFTTKDKSDRKVFAPYKDVGKILYEQNGCNSCHSTDGKKSTGPTWAGLWKSDVPFAAAPAAGGPPDQDLHELHAGDPDAKWEYYLKMSMIKPSYNVVAGFGPMPQSFEGVLSGTPENDEKARAIIEYIKYIQTPDHANYKPALDPEKDANLFDVEKTPLRDKDNNPIHPESLAGIEARKNAAPGGASAPAGTGPGR